MKLNQAIRLIRLLITLQDKINNLEENLLTFMQNHNIKLEELKIYRRKHFSG